MDPNSVLSKTAKGREEVETRNYKLDQRLRALLITVNGKLSAAQLASQFSQSGDDIAMKIEGMKSLEELRGYLESRRAMLDGALKGKAAAFWEKTAALL